MSFFEDKNGKLLVVMFIFLAIFALMAASSVNDVSGANCTVDTEGDDGNTGGVSDPYKSVGKAVDTTNNGAGNDNIIINNGTYKNSNGNNVTNLVISKNVNIYSAKYLNLSNEETYLDAEGNGRFFTINSGITVNFYGINFINGKNTGNGGAIYSNGGTCTFTNVSFTNCSGSGGAIYGSGDNWSFDNVSFTNCTIISGIGGAVYASGDNWSFVDVNFTNCRSSGSVGSGGAVYGSGDNWSFDNVSFTNCTSNEIGGAVNCEGSNWSFVDVNFTNCNSGYGGAIYLRAGSLNISGCDFVSNKASGFGSAVYIADGNVNISYCRFVNNTDDNGYQVYNASSGVVVADYNWWGTNDGLSQTNVAINNWFIMVLNTSATNAKVGNIFRYNYYFMLNDTNGDLTNDPNVGLLPVFDVILLYNGGVVNISDARYNHEGLNVTVNDTANNISAYDSSFYITNLVFSATKGDSNIAVSDVNGTYGKTITLKAVLKNQNGVGLAGKIISFYDGLGKLLANITTDANGIATYTFIPELNAGSYSYSARFGSDAYYLGSNGTAAIVISKLATKLITGSTKFVGTYGKYVTLKATLKGANGKALAGKYVAVYVNGKKVATVKTNSAGLATYKYKVTKTGNQKVEFRFTGDTNYVASSAVSTLAVNKYSKVLIKNTVKAYVGKIKLTSVIRNYGPDKLTAKITYKLAKGLKAVKISSKLGKYSYNKKTNTITLTITNLAKSSTKLTKLYVTITSKKKTKTYVYPKITSKNTLSVKEVNKVI